MISTAIFSPCRTWRYSLTRTWDQSLKSCAFIGLNPSTADERNNDPTVTRCINFAKRWGYGSLVMLNLFALRATDPKVMKAHGNPVGPDNDLFLKQQFCACAITIAAWGVHGRHLDRAEAVLDLLGGPLWCVGTTKGGFPRHPLYVLGSQDPQAYEWREMV